MAQSPVILTLAALALVLGMARPAGARDKGGFLEASENPLLGTWLLSEEGINPNMPIRCANLRLTFAHRPWLYNPIRPNQVAVGSAIYTIIDHDHMLIDEIPKCWYQRGPVDGTTPLIDRIQAEADAQQRPAQLPSPPTYDQAIDQLAAMGGGEPAPATVSSPDVQQSMDQLKRAIQDLQEQVRQRQGR